MLDGSVTKGTGRDSPYPLTKTDWLFRRSLRFRQCSYSNKIIWPWQLAWYQETAYGESNSDIDTWEFQTEWLTPTSYTYKKLLGTL